MSSSKNYFELFGFEPELQIDRNLLNKAYFNLQLKFHPDKAKEEQERQELISKSGEINLGYNLLRDDFKRAQYLFKLKTNEEFSETISDPEILGEMMEIREDIESSNSTYGLTRKEEKIELLMKKSFEELNNYFVSYDFTKAKAILTKLSYYQKIIEEIKVKRKKLKDADSD